MRVQKTDTASSVERQEYTVTQKTENSQVFRRTLTSLAQEGYQAYIQEQIEKITKQGELVCKKADLFELRKYKEMIRGLINETVSNGYEFHKFARHDSHGRRKVFALIQNVDEKLDDLTQGILKSEANNIELLNSVDDIRGLLLDMLM